MKRSEMNKLCSDLLSILSALTDKPHAALMKKYACANYDILLGACIASASRSCHVNSRLAKQLQEATNALDNLRQIDLVKWLRMKGDME